MHRPARQQMNCWSSFAIWEQVGRKPKLKVGNWMIWPQCWTQNGILALEHFAQVFFMCLHTAGNMTGGHTASANEFSQNPYWKTFKRFTWISCMLHSCVQFQISLVIGGHRISAASAKMVSSGVKLEFTILALWRFGKMECSHLWHQPR